MSKVWCAENECEHNKANQCRAREINLSAGRMHTVHEGFCQVWTCRTFKQDEETQKLFEALTLLGERRDDNAADEAEPVKHGRWLDTREWCGDYMCSNCDALYGTNKFDYCPICGAKMDKEEMK